MNHLRSLSQTCRLSVAAQSAVGTLQPRLQRVHRGAAATFSTSSSSSRSAVAGNASEPQQISIPNRIPRGPTDILNALSATVGTDPTAAHYKYHDDPYLIPTSNIAKRTYAMAQEAGRKAAKWIREEHPELFQVGTFGSAHQLESI